MVYCLVDTCGSADMCRGGCNQGLSRAHGLEGHQTWWFVVPRDIEYWNKCRLAARRLSQTRASSRDCREMQTVSVIATRRGHVGLLLIS